MRRLLLRNRCRREFERKSRHTFPRDRAGDFRTQPTFLLFQQVQDKRSRW